ncbi:MAG: hypothetical protein WBF39_09855 [Planococcus donghaensis]
MKRSIIFTLTVLISTLFFLATSAGATGIDVEKMTPTDLSTIFFDEEYGGYYDTELGGYIEVFDIKDGKFTGTVDVEDYIQEQIATPYITQEEGELNESHDRFPNQNPTHPYETNAPQVYYRYTEEGNYQTFQEGYRASIIRENAGPGTDALDLAVSFTKGHNFSVNLNMAEESAVRAGVSYSFEYSASISTSSTLTIPAGYQGYFIFQPAVRVSYGTVRQYNQGYITSTERVTALYPVSLANGTLDGRLKSVKTPLQ